ncbi:MAG: tetratricopeptide repeat protein [Bacteroidales bacterium]|nr:tetratricopeptide repeat protein [Bacteroidales bacterium]
MYIFETYNKQDNVGSKINTKKKQPQKTGLIALSAILLFTVILFSSSINNEILFGWDDGEYIENADIQDFKVKEFFTNYYLGMYQPLAVTTLSINYQLSELNPTGYHLANLMIHLINVVLVFLLFLKITKRFEIIVIVTLLFAIHPMHVEAVSWIATRSNGLYSMFYLASLIFYLKYLDNKAFKLIAISFSFSFFVLSCFSKSMAITLPVTLLLFDYFKDKKIGWNRILEKIPFFIVSLIFGLLTIKAAGEYGHIKNLNLDFNIIDRIVILIYSVIFYLVKAVAPVDLSAVYAYPAKTGGFLPWEYYFGLILFAVLIFNAVKAGKLKKDILFGLLFFLITISVVLPVVWSRMLMLADRYTYIPYLGIFYIFGILYKSMAESKRAFFQKNKTYLFIGFVIYLLFLSITTFQRNKVWGNTESLVNDVIDKNRSDNDVAIGYFFRGNLRDRQQDYQSAVDDFSKAIELNPYYTMAYNNRGIIRGSVQDYKGALSDFSAAVDLEPNYADARYNRGNVYYYLGEPEKACTDWEKAEELGSKQAGKIRRQYCR